MTGDIICDFFYQLNSDIAAPGILHAACGHEPKWIVINPDIVVLGECAFPQGSEIAPRWERLIFFKLAVPPMYFLLVQTPLELLADPVQPFLIRLLEPQAGFDQFGVKVPLQAREWLDPEPVLTEPVEP